MELSRFELDNLREALQEEREVVSHLSLLNLADLRIVEDATRLGLPVFDLVRDAFGDELDYDQRLLRRKTLRIIFQSRRITREDVDRILWLRDRIARF